MRYLIRIPAHGVWTAEPIPQEHVTQEMLAELLHTDVTERMRLPVMPDALAKNESVLCYFIDARGGERGLAANFCGTCFYHTGCPIYGDLLLARCSQDADSADVSGFDAQETESLLEWLRAQFPEYSAAEDC